MWITVAMLPKPSTGLNRSASVHSTTYFAAFLGMTEFSEHAVS
jgi:hypothetical protein